MNQQQLKILLREITYDIQQNNDEYILLRQRKARIEQQLNNLKLADSLK